MSYLVTVVVPVFGFTRGSRKLAERTERFKGEAQRWLDTHRETFRAALNEGDGGFIGLITTDEGQTIEAYEFSREWGTSGVRYGRRTLQAMLDGIRDTETETEEKTNGRIHREHDRDTATSANE